MRVFFFLSCYLVFATKVFSQTGFQECGTLPSYTDKDTLLVPWYGHNEVLYDILDQHKELFQGNVQLQFFVQWTLLRAHFVSGRRDFKKLYCTKAMNNTTLLTVSSY